MGILDPSQFIDESNDPMMLGPAMAAGGNIGGLQGLAMQRSSGEPTMRPASMGGALSQATKSMYERSLSGRIRSPEEMDAAKAERRGALSKYQSAIDIPESMANGWELINEGMYNSPNAWDTARALHDGVAHATNVRAKQRDSKRSNELAKAKTEYDFLNAEEKLDSGEERYAGGEISKIMASENRGGGANNQNGRFKNTSAGLVDMWTMDDQGRPKLVWPSAVMVKEVDEAFKAATAEADSKENPKNFNSIEQREEFIRRRQAQIINDKLYLSGFIAPPDSIYTLIKNDSFNNPDSGPAYNPPNMVPVGGQPPAENNNPTQPDARVFIPQGKGTLPAPTDSRLRTDNRSLAIEERVGVLRQEAAENQAKLNQFKLNPPKTDEERAQQARLQGNLIALNDVIDRMVKTNKAGYVPPTLSTPANEAAKKEEAQTEAKQRQENDFKLIHMPANEAQKLVNSVDTIKAIANSNPRADLETGQLANVKRWIGNFLGSFGMQSDLVDTATNLTSVNKILQAMVNDRMLMEHGVQTKDDAERFNRTFANLKDAKEAFNFALDNLKEISLRQIAKSQHYKDYMERFGNTRNAEQSWQKKVDENYGRTFTWDDTNGAQFRHAWIDEVVKANVANGMDKEEATAKAQRVWLRMAESQGRAPQQSLPRGKYLKPPAAKTRVGE